MNVRDSDGSDSFEGDSMLEDSGSSSRMSNQQPMTAPQSQWKGRRGKPRCDYCRMNKLKCDREQPICNHCSWSSLGDCKYTPLPTPAHRGIPRCDRCRLRDLKCDRNLPVCNHCEMDIAECNYIPKKRHRVSTDGNGAVTSQSMSYGSKAAAFVVSDMGSSNFAITDSSSSSSLQYPPPMHKLIPRGPHSIDPIPAGSSQYKSPNHHLPFDPDVPPYRRSSSLSLRDSDWRRQQRSGIPVDRSRTVDLIPIEHVPIEPWSHLDFVSLPRAITHTVRTLNGSELPNRRTFDSTLTTFLMGLSVELQETAAFSPAHYASIADSLYRHDTSALPPRLRTWALCHHVRSGSRKRHLILVPRESFYGSSRDEEETAAAIYIKQVDEDNGNDVSGSSSFERIPVQSQIFDILLYAHRAHSSPTFMLADIRRVGMAGITFPMAELFVRLCPSCRSRFRNGGPVDY
ncbi:hypothetical protein BDM02DRAFT_3147260 [Thelephora ganbajun]|uniref:Uncharacterized protein n=1 Tax=Thelephora ganbajun TaxID=370292 RepID=A0ACB6ZAM7_THEGA|nr:hypothetical protein BDM02DRAFT_3147260 [Thelephora ganbajun]